MPVNYLLAASNTLSDRNTLVYALKVQRLGERERDTHTERDTDRQTDRQTDSEQRNRRRKDLEKPNNNRESESYNNKEKI